MKQETFNLFDAINREGIDNSAWGLCANIENTKDYFGTDETMCLKGQFAYFYRRQDDSFAYIDKAAKPTYTLHANGDFIDFYRLDRTAMETGRKIQKVREALASGNVQSIEFNRDGSGALFYFMDPTGDHGLPCNRLLSLDIDSAMNIVAGFRFKQHEHKTCF